MNDVSQPEKLTLTSLDIAAQALREGVNDLRRSGLLKAKQGMTSLDEVLSTTNA